MSTSRKDKKTNEYKNSNWSFVRFVGAAYEKSLKLERQDRIVVEGGISQEPYEVDGEKKYPKNPQIVVFNFKPYEYQENEQTGSSKMDTPPVVEPDDSDDDDLPF
jgi:hypothetical protein